MAADRVPDLLAEIDKALEKLTPHDEHVKRSRYEHGGGRMFREYGADRELILDVYNEGDREFYFDAERLLRAAAEALRQLQEALKAARQFLTPGIDRGPAINGWQNTLDMVDEALRGTPPDGREG